MIPLAGFQLANAVALGFWLKLKFINVVNGGAIKLGDRWGKIDSRTRTNKTQPHCWKAWSFLLPIDDILLLNIFVMAVK